MDTAWREKLKRLLPQAKFDEPLAPYTTFRIGGPADAYIELKNIGELERAAKLCRDFDLPFFVFGWGSNLLVLDGGVRGVCVRLAGDFEAVEFLGGGRVRCGAGTRIQNLVAQCAERGLSGGEPLIGVPGTVGGALVMNAGTRDGEIGPLVAEVSVFDMDALRARVLPAAQIEFRYRSSSLNQRVVLGCVLQLKEEGKGDIMKRVREFQQRRFQTQPIHTFNVGSTFKNPPGRAVAELIEKAGLKGAVRGGARVSPMHANFIENFGNATAADVLELVRMIREKIKTHFGVELDLEMKVVGEP